MFIHDSKMFCPLIREAYEEYDIDNKAHDNRRSFNLLGDLNIEPAIRIRKNASTKTKGCPLLKDEVLIIKKLGFENGSSLRILEGDG